MKGTETDHIETVDNLDGTGHRGVPLVKGTETQPAPNTIREIPPPQRRPPREGD